MNDEHQRLAAGNFTLSVILGDTKRQISMTGYVFNDDSPKELNERLDRYQDAIDRQVLRAEMKAHEDNIKRGELAIEQLAAHYEMMVRRKQSGKKLSSQELDQLDKYDVSVEFQKRAIVEARKNIADAKKRLNGAA